MNDPNFARTVVYLLDHTSNGTVGIVINLATSHECPERLSLWESVLAPPNTVFRGGPVQLDGIIGVTLVDSRIETVDLANDVPTHQSTVRLFHGYAGWGPGQLAGEIADDAWLVVDAQLGDVFTATPELLWREVLDRQGGEIAWFANLPSHPNLN